MTHAALINHNNHYATAGELEYISGLASILPKTAQVVMIGAGPGVMGIAVLEGNPDVWLTIIDKDTCEWVLSHMRASGMDARGVTTIVSDSSRIGEVWTAPLDLLIVDGDHSFKGVCRDLEAWLPHVAEGGYVFLHDYDPFGTEFAAQEHYPGVRAAVHRLMHASAQYEAIKRVGTAIVFKKR